MKLKIQQAISLILVLCVIASTGVFGIINVSAAGAGFEADNSYLAYDEYRSLNLYVGSAEDCDKAKDVLPLKNGDYPDLKLTGVEYGWSNPQVLAVMGSAPYWSELEYGTSLASAGSTSFTVSTNESESETSRTNISLGVSVTASATAEVMGFGGTNGYSYSIAGNRAESAQKSKTSGTSYTFVSGAGDDYVALMVVPVVAYKYDYTINGKTESMVVNIQLDPVYGMASVTNYNMVARRHNKIESCQERMMPVIELDKLIDGYTAGDPSTCPSSASDIPESLSIIYGDMELDESCQITPGNVSENQLKGKVYSCDNFYTVGLGYNGLTQNLSFSESTSNTVEMGITLSGSVFGQVSGGGDIGIAKVKGSKKVDVSGSVGMSISYTTAHTKGFSYSMAFANMPQSAVTGVTSLGIDKSPYSFNTKLAVWIPEQQGSKVWSAPAIILPVVSFAQGVTLPPYLPHNFKAIDVTETTVTLNWLKGTGLKTNRFADKYKIMINTTGSIESFTDYVTIDASYFQYDVTDLEPDTTYTLALQAVAKDGTTSAIGAPITVKTKSSRSPVIIQEPKNKLVDEGDEAIFEVIPQGNIDDYDYQWFKLVEDRYGVSWSSIYGANLNTFNAAYYAIGGKVNSSNRYDLDGSTYRCVVTNKKTRVNVTSMSATLYVSDVHLIESYNELKTIKEKIAMGEKEYIYKDYALAGDITVPEGEVWTVPFGTEEHPYQGTFNGKGYRILNYNFNNKEAENAGFFGRTLNAEIKNFNVYNDDYKGGIFGGKNTGGLVGKADKTIIENCNVLIYLTGNGNVGGLVGYANVDTVILNCFARTVLKNNDKNGYKGGAVGYNYGGYIDGMVAESSMNSDKAGGLIGFNFGNIKNSIYNTTNNACEDAIYEAIVPAGDNVRGLNHIELKKIYTYPYFIN